MTSASQIHTADGRFLALLGRAVQQPQPLGDYVPARRVGNLVYLSTTPAKTGRAVTFPGVVGRDLDVAAATVSARWAALTLLEYLWNELDGTFARVRQFVSLTGYVASADGFYDQADVLNGASAVLIEVFGAEIGKPSRSAIGVRHMPRNASVAVGGLVEIAL
ncbi:MAG TPA: RidA family protein [Burkholderiales bacterium]|nr:RidA family protein [Burkholderiales bacterium]